MHPSGRTVGGNEREMRRGERDRHLSPARVEVEAASIAGRRFERKPSRLFRLRQLQAVGQPGHLQGPWRAVRGSGGGAKQESRGERRKCDAGAVSGGRSSGGCPGFVCCAIPDGAACAGSSQLPAGGPAAPRLPAAPALRHLAPTINPHSAITGKSARCRLSESLPRRAGSGSVRFEAPAA